MDGVKQRNSNGMMSAFYVHHDGPAPSDCLLSMIQGHGRLYDSFYAVSKTPDFDQRDSEDVLAFWSHSIKGMMSCFVDEISNCTLDLISNEQCDPQCDSPFCMAYSNENFESPLYDIRNGTNGSLTLWAADSYQCAYNGSLTDDAECQYWSAQSVYLDPNVPAEILCESTWIGTVCIRVLINSSLVHLELQ